MSPDLVLERTSRLTNAGMTPRYGFTFRQWAELVALNQAYSDGRLTEWPTEYRTPTEKFYRHLYRTGRLSYG